MERLTFGGKSFSDFNVFWDGSKVFVKPQKNYNTYDIPGRNGALTASRKYFGNVTVSFNCFIRQNFKKNYSQLMDYLNSFDGYQRLETTTEPDVYRMALFHSAVDPSTGAFNHYGQFTLSFDCMPQQFLKIGENAVDIAKDGEQVLFNPTYQTARPLIKVDGVGSFTVNGSQVVVTENNGNTYIDCDIMDCYETVNNQLVNRNPDVSMEDFPVLIPGENVITTFRCSLEIVPRWWRV